MVHKISGVNRLGFEFEVYAFIQILVAQFVSCALIWFGTLYQTVGFDLECVIAKHHNFICQDLGATFDNQRISEELQSCLSRYRIFWVQNVTVQS